VLTELTHLFGISQVSSGFTVVVAMMVRASSSSSGGGDGASGRGEPGHHARVRRVSQDIHVDLVASVPELTVQATMVRGSPRVGRT
jgi:hypothetical protein